MAGSEALILSRMLPPAKQELRHRSACRKWHEISVFRVIRTVYGILRSAKNRGKFESIFIVGQRRITRASYEAWYAGLRKK